MPSAAISTDKTLSKAFANLRWLIEKNGVDPETVVVSIGVRNRAEKDRLTVGLGKEFDSSCMRAPTNCPESIIVHGIPIFVFDNSRRPS